jgi:hypothetical protein
MAFTVTGLDGWAIPDLRIAVYSPRNTRGDGCLAPAGWQAGRLTCRLAAPVHRQGFAKAIKDIPGGSRRAMGQYRHLSRLFRRPPARAPRTAVILMVHCRGPGWLTGPLSVSSWIRSAIGQSPG